MIIIDRKHIIIQSVNLGPDTYSCLSGLQKDFGTLLRIGDKVLKCEVLRVLVF